MDDVRFALRQLRKSPAFAVTAVFTLALGLCASLAIFAFADAALIQPIPYSQPHRLVGVYEKTSTFPFSNLSYLDYIDWKRMNTAFAAFSAYQGSGSTLTTPGGAIRVTGARVSADFFRTLGVTPILGRGFRDGEDQPAAAKTVILSYGAWQSRFGGRADVLGQHLTLNDEPSEVVGVLPKGFSFAPVEPADFWRPLQQSGACEARRSCHNLFGVARLADGVTVEQATANVASIAGALEHQYPDTNRGQGSAVVPLPEVIVGRVRPILTTLLGGAVLLLIIAAINVSGLLLVRAEARRREIAIRGALGASRLRIVRQFVAEGSVLVAAGAALGIAGAAAAVRLLAALIPENMLARLPFMRTVGLHGNVWVAAAAVCLASVALFALIPVLQSFAIQHSAFGLRHASFGSALSDSARGSSGRAWSRVGGKLVAIELALAMVLLAGDLLLARSLYGVLHVATGMRTGHVVMIGVDLPRSYQGNAKLIAVHRLVEDRVRALPGVEAVGTTSTRPLQGGNTNWIRFEGRPFNGEHNDIHAREIDEGYFAAVGARLLRGRGFLPGDDATKPNVVIVNQTLARTYFPNEDPIGRKLFYVSLGSRPPLEIVGVVDDIKESPLDTVTPPTMYTAFNQDPDDGFWLFVRTSQATDGPQYEDALLPTLASAIHDLDPGLATVGGNRLVNMVEGSDAAYIRRSGAWLVGGFAALAWVLGVVGLYGVVAYSVGRRTREIGVRMALGAERSSVARLILGEAGRVVIVGILTGAVAAVGAAALVRTLLFGVAPWDVPTLAGVAAVLGLSALLASYIPARRAAALNPVEALRTE